MRKLFILTALILLMPAHMITAAEGTATPNSGESRPFTGLKLANKEQVEKEIKELEDQLQIKQNELARFNDNGSDKIDIGKKADIDGLSITIDGYEFSDERNMFDDTNPDSVIIIKYTAENETDEPIYVSEYDFKFYVNNKSMEIYPLKNSSGDLSPGRILEGFISFGIHDEGSFELEKVSHDWSSKNAAIWNLN